LRVGGTEEERRHSFSVEKGKEEGGRRHSGPVGRVKREGGRRQRGDPVLLTLRKKKKEKKTKREGTDRTLESMAEGKKR